MKTNHFSVRPIIGAAILSLFVPAVLSSCNRDDSPVIEQAPDKMGSIALTVECDMPGGPETRAVTPYTTVESYESAVVKAEIFVFDATSGVLNAYQNLTSLSLTDGHLPVQNLPCTQGSKHVYAILNGGSITGLSAVRTEAALQAMTSDLSQNERSTSSGFLMMGRKDINVSGDNQSCAITAKRLAFRVVLQKITNSSALGTLSVKSVFLINSARQLALSMPDDATMPITDAAGYNVAGKKTGSSSFIVSGATSDVPNMLYQDYTANVSSGTSVTTRKMVYGYPHTATGTSNVRLVVLATLAGNDYYYPMNIPAPLANDTYTVELTIKNIGSNDPNTPVETGSASVTITVDGWTSRDSIDATI